MQVSQPLLQAVCLGVADKPCMIGQQSRDRQGERIPHLVSERFHGDDLQEQGSQILNCTGSLKGPTNATLPFA